MRIGGGWEEVGTLAPGQPQFSGNLLTNSPNSPILILEQSSKPEEAGGRPGASVGSFQKRDSVRERLSGLASSPSQASSMGRSREALAGGQAPCRVRARAMSQKVLGLEASVPTDISARCQGA